MAGDDETWRMDMALDFYNSLPESQREAFKESYMKRFQERIDAGEIPVWLRKESDK